MDFWKNLGFSMSAGYQFLSGPQGLVGYPLARLDLTNHWGGTDPPYVRQTQTLGDAEYTPPSYLRHQFTALLGLTAEAPGTFALNHPEALGLGRDNFGFRVGAGYSLSSCMALNPYQPYVPDSSTLPQNQHYVRRSATATPPAITVCSWTLSVRGIVNLFPIDPQRISAGGEIDWQYALGRPAAPSGMYPFAGLNVYVGSDLSGRTEVSPSINGGVRF
ncbi:MAG: hypothetical protein HQM15_11450 [Deltaproteobacteria bacterium]|nr:hypothetical protein [Deltaproteobacteria bacterium]